MQAVSGTPEYCSTSRRPLRDTLVLGATFLAVFTAFQSLQNLQSSLHQDRGLGVASLAVLYGCMCLVSVFTPAVVYNLGVKATVMLAWAGHCVYVASNVYPHWATLLPGSVLLGALSVPLWTASKVYITAWALVLVDRDLERREAERREGAETRQKEEVEEEGRGLKARGEGPSAEGRGLQTREKNNEEGDEEGTVGAGREGRSSEESRQEEGRGQENGRGLERQEKGRDQENGRGLERQEKGRGPERQRNEENRTVVKRSPHQPPVTFHAAFSRLNGLFTAVFHVSQLTGNFVSSVILFQSSYVQEPLVSYPSTTTCGAGYCPREGQGHRLAPPHPFIIYILLSVFLVLDLLGLGITWRFVPSLVQPHYTGKEVSRKLRSYWSAYRELKLWLLVPCFLSQSMNFTLIVTLFTEAYVSCALGIRMVGYVMAAWGLMSVVAAALLGYAARFTGRQFLFAVAYLGDAAVLLLLLWWRPHSASLPVMLCVALVRGVVDSIWSVQGSALVAMLFPTTVDSAFSFSATWHGLAMASCFFLAGRLCPLARLHGALALLAASLLGYVAVELVHRRRPASFSRGEQAYALLTFDPGDEDIERGGGAEASEEEETVFARAAGGNSDGEGGAPRDVRDAGGDVTNDVGGDIMVDGSRRRGGASGAEDVTANDGDEFRDTDVLIDRSRDEWGW